MEHARQSWNGSRVTPVALDAADAINAYERFLEVEHLSQPDFELASLLRLIPGEERSPFGYIGNHREGIDS